jgi:hypothetical protein
MKYEALLDGCEGDSKGLQEALGEGYSVIKSTGDDGGWGHHSYNTIYRSSDGRVIHAECGGCSCFGNGSWSYEESVEMAERMIPEDERE